MPTEHTDSKSKPKADPKAGVKIAKPKPTPARPMVHVVRPSGLGARSR